MRYTLPSLAKPNMRYGIHESVADCHDFTQRSIISRHLTMFDTLGDGETQHAHEYCPDNHWDNQKDFVESILEHLTIVQGDILDNLRRIFVPYTLPTTVQLTFFQKLRYDEDKYWYVNFDECKKSRSDSKAYDKRWERVDDRYDGSMDVVLSACHQLDGCKFLDVFQGITMDLHVWDHCGRSNYELAHWTVTNSGTVYADVDQQEMLTWLNKVEWIGDYLTMRCDLIRYEGTIKRMIEQQRTVLV